MSQYEGCELPDDLYYDLDYVWARPNEDGTMTLGVTDPAQTMSGLVQAVTYRRIGTHRTRGRPVAVVESGKWVGGIPAPFDGTIEAVNEAVAKRPRLINIAPYTDAWLVVMRPDVPAHALDSLHTGGEAIDALKAWIDRYRVQCLRCSE